MFSDDDTRTAGFWGQVLPALCPWCCTLMALRCCLAGLRSVCRTAPWSSPLVVGNSLFHFPECWGPFITTILFILSQGPRFLLHPRIRPSGVTSHPTTWHCHLHLPSALLFLIKTNPPVPPLQGYCRSLSVLISLLILRSSTRTQFSSGKIKTKPESSPDLASSPPSSVIQPPSLFSVSCVSDMSITIIRKL